MRSLSFDELLAAANLSEGALGVLRQRKQIALAFGRRDAYRALRYVELDAVGVLLAEDLSRNFTRKIAAQIVRVHGDVWAAAVGAAENSEEPIFFFVLEATNPSGERAHLTTWAPLAGINKMLDEMAQQLVAAGYTKPRLSSAFINQAIEQVRANAKKAKIDLSGRFMVSPESPEFRKLIEPYVEIRDRAKARLGQIRRLEDLTQRAGNQSRAIFEADLPEEDSQ